MSYLINCGGSVSADFPELVEGFDALRSWVSAGQLTLTNKTVNFSLNNFVGFQATLVSGTNIKTINGNSLLGSGDLKVGKMSPTMYFAGQI